MSAGHDHSHATASFDKAFAIGIVLNLSFVGIEAFYGWKIDSLSLLADAGHNLSDVAGLVLAWGGAGWQATGKPASHLRLEEGQHPGSVCQRLAAADGDGGTGLGGRGAADVA